MAQTEKWWKAYCQGNAAEPVEINVRLERY